MAGIDEDSSIYFLPHRVRNKRESSRMSCHFDKKPVKIDDLGGNTPQIGTWHIFRPLTTSTKEFLLLDNYHRTTKLVKNYVSKHQTLG